MSNQPAGFRAPSRRRRAFHFHIHLHALVALMLGHGIAAASSQVDLSQLPIEKLLNLEVIEVYSASKFVQKASEAPTAVSVITAADIKAFGWRSLADILRSLRGLYVSNDRNYQYLGARGFLRPGDYNTRFLLLVDGYRINDAVFDQASIGSEFPLDVDLIDRVEYVPGPGSSIYGANALFGVINVISRRGANSVGPQASAEAGSHGQRKARMTYGWRGGKDAELLLSASAYRVDGQDLHFPEFDNAAGNHGIAQGLDYDRGQSVFAKAAAGPFSLAMAHAERRKGVPTASFSQVFNDPRSHTTDIQNFIDLGYRAALGNRSDLAMRLFWGRYDYQGDYIYGNPPAAPQNIESVETVVNRDGSRARWRGAEAKLVSTRFDSHKLLIGAEYQRDYRAEQFNFDLDPHVVNLDDRRSGNRMGVYLQDEIAVRGNLLVNTGLRYDRTPTAGGTLSPRFGLIYKPRPATTVKVLYGKAFRAPNAYELYYQLFSAGGQKANPDLKLERIRTHELIIEHQLSAGSRITAALFHNRVSGLITQTTDPADGLLVFRNLDKATARGLELEFERIWSGRAKLRTSYSLQQTRDGTTGAALVNSPRQLAKFNLSAPMPGSVWRTGVEAQYTGRRNTLRGETGGYWLANLTVFSARLARGMEASASVYNLFDRRYADPGAQEHAQDAIGQDGRSFRLKMSYAF